MTDVCGNFGPHLAIITKGSFQAWVFLRANKNTFVTIYKSLWASIVLIYWIFQDINRGFEVAQNARFPFKIPLNYVNNTTRTISSTKRSITASTNCKISWQKFTVMQVNNWVLRLDQTVQKRLFLKKIPGHLFELPWQLQQELLTFSAHL